MNQRNLAASRAMILVAFTFFAGCSTTTGGPYYEAVGTTQIPAEKLNLESLYQANSCENHWHHLRPYLWESNVEAIRWITTNAYDYPVALVRMPVHRDTKRAENFLTNRGITRDMIDLSLESIQHKFFGGNESSTLLAEAPYSCEDRTTGEACYRDNIRLGRILSIRQLILLNDEALLAGLPPSCEGWSRLVSDAPIVNNISRNRTK